MKRILVTGATGFVGRQTLPLLLSRGFEVHAVTSQDLPRENRKEIWHRADLMDSRQVEMLMAEVSPSHLLHLAWIATPGTYLNSPDNLRWLQAGIELSRQFVAAGGARLVAAGSCAEYDWHYGFCSESLTPSNPRSLYGSCKHSLHLAAGAFARESRVSFAWGRIFFPYGPYEHPNRLIASVITSLLRGKTAECSAGFQVRDYIFVRDVADALVALVDSEITGTMNVASGRGVMVKDIVLKIGEMLERPELVRLGALKSSIPEFPLVVGDVRALTEKLHWTPTYDLDDGLRSSIEWWRQHLN